MIFRDPFPPLETNEDWIKICFDDGKEIDLSVLEEASFRSNNQ